VAGEALSANTHTIANFQGLAALASMRHDTNDFMARNNRVV
jgi:hypothetical protein